MLKREELKIRRRMNQLDACFKTRGVFTCMRRATTIVKQYILRGRKPVKTNKVREKLPRIGKRAFTIDPSTNSYVVAYVTSV